METDAEAREEDLDDAALQEDQFNVVRQCEEEEKNLASTRT
jgi:hypothetical protein